MKQDLPKFHEQMLPLLELYRDGKAHKLYDLEKDLAKKMSVPNELLEVTYDPSNPKSRTIFLDRMGWARTYLAKAKLIERIATNTYIITERGQKLLAQKPTTLNRATLQELYPDFWDEHTTRSAKVKHGEIEESDEGKTPEELITASTTELRAQVKEELLEKLLTMSPRQFEFLVVELLERMGYGIGETTRYSQDGGIDGLVKSDYLGFELVYVQAKRWQNNVGRRDVSQFIGDILQKGAKKGIFITTSGYNKEALNAPNVQNLQLILINGEELAQYMIDLELGVSVAQNHKVYKVDTDYFEES